MKKNIRHPLIFSLLLIIFLFFMGSKGYLAMAEDNFVKAISPVQKRIYQFSLKGNNFIDLVFSLRNSHQENVELAEENNRLLAKIAQLQGTEAENEFLRQQNGLPIPQNKELILAEIIGRSLGNNGYFLINRGSLDGLQEKAVVIYPGNILIGLVTKVNESFSEVCLIINPSSKVNSLIRDSQVSGLTEGTGNGLIIDLLPQDKEIREETLVVSSGAAGIFPANLLIGKIKKVISLPTNICQKAEIETAVDFNQIEKVLVIKK